MGLFGGSGFHPSDGDFDFGGQQYGAALREKQMDEFGNNAESRGGAVIDQTGMNQSLGNSSSIGGQQQSQADYLRSVMNGTAGPPVAQQEMQKGTDQSIAAQMAMANSARGGASGFAAAQQGAQSQAGAMQSQNVQ